MSHNVFILCAALILTVIAVYAAYLLWGKIKAGDFRTRVTSLVEAAEQLLRATDPDGSKRKAFVTAALERAGYDITEYVNAMIEAAVYRLNLAQKK